jgi:prevent-host-death family protein
MNLSKDIHSLTDFKRRTADFIAQLKESGNPLVLTVNGKAELVVQDARSYQRLLDLAERTEELELTRQAVAEMRAGQGRPAEEMLAEMRQILDETRAR